MNRTLATLGAALAASLLSTVLPAAEERTVHIYNWIEYLPPEILKDFQTETGIRPVYDVFDSVEMLEAKLLAGNSGYDVAFPSSANIAKFIEAGAFEPLDRHKLSNWAHLDDGFMVELASSSDPGNRYAVPYMWGTTLIGYNIEKVRAALGPDVRLDSWALVFNPDNMAKLAKCGVGFLDAPNEILPIALRYLGLPDHSKEPADYQKAKQLLLAVRPSIAYFNSSRYGMDLANGDICVGVGWSGGVALAEKLARSAGKGVTIAMSMPKEGVPLWADVMIIPKDAPHNDEAHAFINYLLRPDVIAKASNALGYPNANKDATALVDEDIRSNPNMYIPDERRALLFPLRALPLPTERLRTRTWNAIRSGR